MSYLENMTQEMIKANAHSRTQPKNNAWDNKKGKTRKLMLPRGKVFQRLENRERTAWWNKLTEGLV